MRRRKKDELGETLDRHKELERAKKLLKQKEMELRRQYNDYDTPVGWLELVNRHWSLGDGNRD